MTNSQKLVRNLPPHLADWISKRPRGVTQNEFILQVLESAHHTGFQPTLFEGRKPVHDNSDLPRFIDLFAGIGGFRIGMEANGFDCVWTSEIDKYAQRTYQAWFGAEEIQSDINDPELDLAEIPDHEVLCGGFPCQPFSIAGVSKKNSLGRKHGFDDEHKGNLFFRICDIVEVKRPPVLFLENVKNLRSHDKGNTWRVIQERLDKLDYVVFDQTIDARAWVPQHRERIFIVAFDRKVFGPEPGFKFPTAPIQEAPLLGSILQKNVDPKYTLSDKLWEYLQGYAAKHKAAGNGFGYGLVGPKDVSRTMSARYYKDGSEILIKQRNKNPRRLNIRESALLLGYTDELARIYGHENGFPQAVSDTQAYKQFGNSVVPLIVKEIAGEIAKVIKASAVSAGDHAQSAA